MKKSILITGCSTGIGYCAAKTLHQRGYQVFATARKAADVERLRQEGLTALVLDVDNSNSIQQAVSEVLQQTGGTLDALFNNAGYAQGGAVEDVTRDAIRAQFETNLFGLLELTNLIIPIMRRQGHGRIVNVSSVLGLVSMPLRGAYNASKYALEGLSDTLRIELFGTGINVILIEPGPIHSQFRDTALKKSVAAIDVENSPYRDLYRDLYEGMKQMQKEPQKNQKFILPPDAVVDKLIKALESNRPKPRYFVTVPTYLFATLKRLLSTRLLDKILLRMWKKIRKS